MSTAAVQEPPVLKESPVAAAERLMSIDALRGFDMFWIVGAEMIVRGLKKLGDNPIVNTISTQLEHVNWEGLHFEDLIFPLFVYIVGVSVVFSLSKAVAQGGQRAALIRVARRALLMYAIGIFYYGGFANKWPGIRLVGVLQRIAICYLAASIIYCAFRVRGIIASCAIILIGYWALMTFVPVPGVGAGHFAERENLSDYIDKMYLPGRKWNGDHDPEGLLSTLPAIASCLLGVLSGLLLKNESVAPKKKVLWLIGGGLAAIALGYAWSLQFPIIKKLWTSSYVLVVGGYSSILLGVFYLIVDIWKVRGWAMPFVWIGTNAITIYLLENMVGSGTIEKIARRFVGGDIEAALGNFGPLVVALIAFSLVLLLMNFLYRKKIFLRI